MEAALLAEYQPPREGIPLSGGKSLYVRGLATEDIAKLVLSYSEKLGIVIEAFRAAYSQQNIDIDTAGPAALSLALNVPDLVHEAIALAADQPGGEVYIRHMPFGKQVEILKTVMLLTLTDVGGLKNFLAIVAQYVGGLPAPKPAATRSPKNRRTSDSSSTPASPSAS